ncbi:hypothetical protein GHT06_020974 [Daphnia sinensis]|uniref:alpha-1,2-Mannosidase n=1 Tax=Daphnia sinensis TaxID=1820382 RepID=A0AAD5L8M1_9CRUS|nr:hypothetical protein GHT06_020974 [Daphnia sinensis]
MGTFTPQWGFTSVPVPPDFPYPATVPGTEQNRRKRLWRRWNQLSRFQRNTCLLFMALLITLSILFVLPNLPPSASLPSPSRNEALEGSEIVQGIKPSLEYEREPEGPPKPITLSKSVQENFRPLTKEEEENHVGENEKNSVNLPRNGIDPFGKKNQKIVFTGPTNHRQRAVVDAFSHAWKGYKTYAWGHDHLRPISQTYNDWFHLGLTIIDSLDTMYIMGLNDDFNEARSWVKDSLQFNGNRDINLFETTIRVLGGLLSTYHLSGDKLFLDKALELGLLLLPSFKTSSGVPYSDVNLGTKKAHPPKWNADSTTSEVTTIQLEFRDLSRSTGDPTFEELSFRVSKFIHKLPKTEGLVPIFINPNTGQFRKSTITLGARGDSYYEYLLKQWIQTGRTIDFLRDDYNASISGVKNLLVRHSKPNNLLFVGELINGNDFKAKMDHLLCFLPGTLALGVHYGMPPDHLRLAEDLLYTCYQTYAAQPTHLAPEITYFNEDEDGDNDMIVKPADSHNLLRPETVESLWYMYHLTGNTTYQDWGWKIFQAFEKFARVENGYSSLGNVKSIADTKLRDMMESFFLGETLKYFYLLFSDDQKTLSVDRFVLNSEAHFFPIHTSR